MVQPGRTLADVFPTVAATWHPTNNGELQADMVASRTARIAFWRCAVGHEWSEAVSTRTSMPAWKRGDIAACRLCTGTEVVKSFPCGHTAQVRAERTHYKACPNCRERQFEERQAEYPKLRAAASQAYAEAAAEAADLLASVPLPDLPAPLLAAWRTKALAEIRAAIPGERVYGKSGAVGQVLETLRMTTLQSLVPHANELRAAVAARQPVKILDRAHWAPGWLHTIGEPAPFEPLEEDDAADSLRRFIVGQLDLLANDSANGAAAADVTSFLTSLVKSWAYDRPYRFRCERWAAYRELTLPVTTGKSARFGRVDLVVMRPSAPDIVVEIDSSLNRDSAQKLVFALAAGAIPIWIRWRGGSVEAPVGLHVVNLVDRTRGWGSSTADR